MIAVRARAKVESKKGCTAKFGSAKYFRIYSIVEKPTVNVDMMCFSPKRRTWVGRKLSNCLHFDNNDNDNKTTT